MSAAQTPIRNLKVIVGIIALAWAVVMIAFFLAMNEKGDWMEDTASLYAFVCGLAALVGAVFTYLRKKWAVILYLLASLALLLTPFMQGSLDLPFTMDWGYLALLAVYLIAVIPAWKHLGSGDA